MKNLATFKNEVCLIAGSGLFAFEAASFLNTKGCLKKIILLSKNNNIKKDFKKICFHYDIRDLEKIITDIKKENIKNVIIVGYVDLPPIYEIKLRSMRLEGSRQQDQRPRWGAFRHPPR